MCQVKNGTPEPAVKWKGKDKQQHESSQQVSCRLKSMAMNLKTLLPIAVDAQWKSQITVSESFGESSGASF